MFDFEKLEVYQKAKIFHLVNEKILRNHEIQTSSRQQLHRASLSVVLNLAEGAGRFSRADRKNFYIISRSSVFECIALLDLLRAAQYIDQDFYDTQYALAEEISKITHALIKSLNH